MPENRNTEFEFCRKLSGMGPETSSGHEGKFDAVLSLAYAGHSVRAI